MHDRLSIGPRISIRGTTGSGKTTLGHILGQQLGLPVVELDAIYWLPNWQVKPFEQFRTDVQAALEACPQGWICVGNYRHIQDLVLPQADTVLWLRLPFRVSFWRLFKQIVRGGPGNSCGKATRTRSPGARVSSAVSLFCCTPSPVARCTWRTPCTS